MTFVDIAALPSASFVINYFYTDNIATSCPLDCGGCLILGVQLGSGIAFFIKMIISTIPPTS